MTQEAFTEQLPLFTNNPAPPSKPPFMFRNLSVRIFPLRANLDSLQQLCDSYLNFIPPEVGRFRAAWPYAYLALLDYGEIAGMVNSIGWFSQTEVYFGVPVEWYQRVNGRWIFRHWAVITPFIYVDDDFSVPLGRTVFGYPKTLAKVTNNAGEWLKNSTGPITLASVETRMFPRLYAGERPECRVFLEVERAAPMSNFRLPPDPKSPMAPWTIVTRLAEAMAGFGRDAMRMGQFMRISEPNPASDPSFLPSMLDCLMPALSPGGKGVTLNSINLKQFRSAAAPFDICFQALTNAGLQMMAFNGSGLLGEEFTSLGDLTGGHCIKLYDYPSLPIVNTLGLEVSKRWRGDGVDVDLLKPVMPFWANLNVKFLPGENLAWRTNKDIWYGGNGREVRRNPAEASQDSILFNTTVASSVDDAVTGPFEFHQTTVQVLPLIARRRALRAFLDAYINKALKPGAFSGNPNVGTWEKREFRFSVWARPKTKLNTTEDPVGGDHAYVYATATTFGRVSSDTNDVGDWANYELSFLIPVKFESRKWQEKDWRLEGVGLIPACGFVDNSTAAVSRSEVLGIPTLRADFVRPANTWLGDAAANVGDNSTLLEVRSEVFTALHVGQKASIQPVFEIRVKDASPAGDKWTSCVTPQEWGRLLELELETKNSIAVLYPDEYSAARALALEILGNRTPVALYTLKQFQDVADPERACYQSLVRVSRAFEEVNDIREVEKTLEVRLHDFPTLALVKTLGIVATTLTEDETGVSYKTQAIRPFYIRAKITEELGEELLSRSGNADWKFDRKVSTGILGVKKRGKAFSADIKARRTQDEGDPCQMGSLMYQAAQRRRENVPPFSEEERLELMALRTPRLFHSRANPAWGASKEVMQRVTREIARLRKPENRTERKARLKKLLDREMKQNITKPNAIKAFAWIDPQMVIESILSREWGNRDDNAHWRRGRNEVLKSRELLLFTQAGGLESLEPDGETRPKPAQKPPKALSQTMHEATSRARQIFVQCERELYMNVLDTLVHKPGRRSMHTDVAPRIETLTKLTKARLEMQDDFTVVAAWNISQRLGTRTHVSMNKLAEVVPSLLRAIRDISKTINSILGERWPYNVDIEMVADANRLDTLLRAVGENTGKYFSYPNGEKPDARIKRQEQSVRILKLIDEYREAVFLAIKLCNVNRSALIDKLARVYQKPDFCVRRDSVDQERETIFSLSLSWDDDWYAGDDMQKALLGGNATDYVSGKSWKDRQTQTK